MRAILIIAFTFLVVDARAQTIVINPRPLSASATAPAKAQRVTINITIVNAASVGMGASEMTAGFTAADQALYSVVDHECDVLGPLLHGDCRLVQMTTNGNISERPNFGPQQGPVISVTASATFELDPKPAAPPKTSSDRVDSPDRK